MIFIGTNAYWEHALKTVSSSTQDSLQCMRINTIKSYTDEIISCADNLYIIDVADLSDGEEVICEEVNKIASATNADVIIAAPGMSIDMKLLTSLSALGFTKICVQDENLGAIRQAVKRLMELPKVNISNVDEEVISRRDDVVDLFKESDPRLENVITAAAAEEEIAKDSIFNDFDMQEFLKEYNSIPKDENSLGHNPEQSEQESEVLEDSGNENSSEGSNETLYLKKKTRGVTKVAVVGVMNRIGTTTVAIQLVKYINQIEERSGAYLECNESGYVQALRNVYDVENEDENLSKVTFNNVDLYSNPRKVGDIFQQGYNFLIYDYGSLSNNTIPNSIYDKDIIIVVGGGEPDEVNALTETIRNIEQKNVFYIFNFVPKYDQEEIMALMLDAKLKTFFLEYTPDRFVYNPKHKLAFNSILNSDYEVKDVTNGKNKRLGRLFNRK